MNLNTEKKLWKQGYQLVVGIDEAGRGPLAGPVMAGAVILFSNKINPKLLKIVNDSKKLSSKQREIVFQMLAAEPQIVFGVGKVSEKIIDKINILEAVKLAMQKAVKSLIKKIGESPDFLIIDGINKINMPIEQKTIIKGDAKIFSCAAASIIAKVTRDHYMDKMHLRYPQYGFNQHKGYGTKQHLKTIKQFGLCPIHRKTFSSLANYSFFKIK